MNQKGFALALVIIAVLFVGIFGGGIYYYRTHIGITKPEFNFTPQPSVSPVKETTDSKRYSNTTLGITFEYKTDDWEDPKEQTALNYTLLEKSNSHIISMKHKKSGGCPENKMMGRACVFYTMDIIAENNSQNLSLNNFINQELALSKPLTNHESIDAYLSSFKFEEYNNAQGIQFTKVINPSTLPVIYYILKDSKVYQIHAVTNEKNYTDAFEQVISSFKFLSQDQNSSSEAKTLDIDFKAAGITLKLVDNSIVENHIWWKPHTQDLNEGDFAIKATEYAVETADAEVLSKLLLSQYWNTTVTANNYDFSGDSAGGCGFITGYIGYKDGQLRSINLEEYYSCGAPGAAENTPPGAKHGIYVSISEPVNFSKIINSQK